MKRLWNAMTCNTESGGSSDLAFLEDASISELKAVLQHAGVQYAGVTEKSELVALAAEAMQSLAGPMDQARLQLEMLVDHALERECGMQATAIEEMPTTEKAWFLLRHTASNVARMTADWLRVGFCQGNFNADNCLISGRTMDYGPFGFVEAFSPSFGSWVGSGQHFAFMNQPEAGLMNIKSLMEGLLPILGTTEREAWRVISELYEKASSKAKCEIFASKLGLSSWDDTSTGALLNELLSLMQECGADWTITWRQLASCLSVGPDASDDALVAPLAPASDQILAQKIKWAAWLRRWIAMVDAATGRDAAIALIKAVSPTFVPREWILKDVYGAAGRGDYSKAKELFEVFKAPFADLEDVDPKYAQYYAHQATGRIS